MDKIRLIFEANIGRVEKQLRDFAALRENNQNANTCDDFVEALEADNFGIPKIHQWSPQMKLNLLWNFEKFGLSNMVCFKKQVFFK